LFQISPFAAPFFDLDLVGKIFLFLKKKTSASCGVVLGKVVNVYKKKVNAKNWQEEWGKT
jgi:hypothetical protein